MKDETTPTRLHESASEINLKKVREMMAAHARDLHREIEVLREELAEKDKDFELFRDSVIRPVLKHLYGDKRLSMNDDLIHALRCAQADLQGIMPELEPGGDRDHPGWQTLEELNAIITQIDD